MNRKLLMTLMAVGVLGGFLGSSAVHLQSQPVKDPTKE